MGTSYVQSRLTIVAIQTIFGIMIQAINAFPLFAVMLRLKSPGRIPGANKVVSEFAENHMTETSLLTQVEFISECAAIRSTGTHLIGISR